MSDFGHIPVLFNEVIEALKIKEGEKYIDATLGGGGHTKKIIEKGGVVLGLDQDEDAIRFVKEDQILNIKNKTLTVLKGNFREIKKIAEENGFGKALGVLFDLGVSSFQLNTSDRGFSIIRNGKLDMRMDRHSGLSAYDVVNKYKQEDLKEIFEMYGEEVEADKIAREIVKQRVDKPIETTGELAEIVRSVVTKKGKIHPATRVFQAIRIEVNDEIEALKEAINDSILLLDSGGRLVIISFHSLEDRIVKRVMKEQENLGNGRMVNTSPITASDTEIKNNPRSRSAKLRIFEKI